MHMLTRAIFYGYLTAIESNGEFEVKKKDTEQALKELFNKKLDDLDVDYSDLPYFKEYNCMIELFTGKDFYTRET